VGMVALSFRDGDLEVPEFGCLSPELDIALNAWLSRIGTICLQTAKALEGVVPDHCGSQVRRSILSGCTLDPSTPAASMFSSWEFDELGGDVDHVHGVVDGLAAAAAHIVFVPAISVKFMLFTRVSESCQVSN
jgi:hypothetical protein